MILLVATSVWLIALLMTWARRARNDAWRDTLAIGAIGAATAGFFWRVLFGDAWMPAGGGDLAQFLYPTYAFAAEWWRHGVIPLWNPYLFGGMPFVGDIQSGVFYPLNLLTFFLTNPLTFRDMEFLSILHFAIAGAGMYALLRFGNCKLEIVSWKLETASNIQLPTSNFQLSRLAALAGAIAFEFSDLFITHFGNLNLIAVVAWMPLVLLFYQRAITDRRASFAAIAGIILAIAFYAGHIQSFLTILIALAAFAVYYTFFDRRPQMADGGRWSAVGGLIIVGLVSFGLSAPVLFPALEMTQHTLRAEFPYEQAARFSLPPAQLIGLFVPGFFGRGPQNAWGPWDRVEVGYIGVLPIVLALLALILRRDAPTRFFGALALLGLALALGGYAILHGWLYQFAPGFGQLRAPARFIVLFDFAIATLCAFGFDALLRALPRASELAFKRIVRAAPWAFLLIALATGASAYTILILGQGQDAALFARMANAVNALAFFLVLLALALGLVLARATRFFHRVAWAALALALIFFDLLSLGAYTDITTDNPARVYEHPDAVAFLKSAGLYRIDPRGTGVDSLWTADTALLYNLFDVGGDNPLVLADFDRYWESLGSRSTRLYDLLNVRYVIGRKNIALDREKFRVAFDGDPAVNIYENTRVLPRAFVVFDARVVPDKSAALAAIHAEDFEPARMVVLEKAMNSEQSTVNSQQSTVNSEQSAVKIVGYGPNDIVMEMNTSSAGVLVLSEVYYPGWQAWVDDQATPVLRANYLFRAVELPAGAHRVRFKYAPMTINIGAGLAMLTVGLLIGAGVWRKLQRTTAD
ncbi:MAG: YfhO family protein [Chloroflexi bacterium]|nr:YfhO family protein [Chloroflexota bacterium]